jgi:hypothetical protein
MLLVIVLMVLLLLAFPVLFPSTNCGRDPTHFSKQEAHCSGFRPRTATVNLESPQSVESLVAKASPAFLDALRRLLSEKR